MNKFFGMEMLGVGLSQSLFRHFLTNLCGMEVYKDVTSKEIIICWSGMVMLFMVLAKEMEFLIVEGWGSYWILSSRNLARLCVGEEVPSTRGRSGMLGLCNLGKNVI